MTATAEDELPAPRPVLGAVMILCASAFVAASTLAAKQLSVGPDSLSPFQITWGRFVFAFAAATIAIPFIRPVFSRPRARYHAIRIGCGFTGVTAMFAATAFVPLADVTAITFLNPILAMVLAIPILGERIGMVRWSTAAFALVGALLLIRPGTDSFQPAALLALLAAFVFGLEVIMLKLLAAREGAFQIIIIANMMGTILSSIVCVFVWKAPTPTQWMLMLFLALTMLCAQVFYTNALRIGEASFVLPFSYATLLFAGLYDFALFGVIPLPASLAGGAVLVASGIVLAWRDGINQRREKA